MLDWVEQFGRGVAGDFADLPDGEAVARIVLRLILAAVLGGVLGFQRGRTGKSAGVRTHMLVGLGAALIMVVCQQAGMTNADLSRVVQGLLAGIGFLGAGAILKPHDEEESHVRGLTTAACLWLTAALGMAAGMGKVVAAVLGAVLAFLILAAQHRLLIWLGVENGDGPSREEKHVLVSGKGQ